MRAGGYTLLLRFRRKHGNGSFSAGRESTIMHSASRIIVEMSRNLAGLYILAAMAMSGIFFAIASSAAEDTHQVPVMDGGAGPCSLELTVTGPDGKPVYAADVKVHINYGFGGFHKLDLEAGTNADGKLKF